MPRKDQPESYQIAYEPELVPPLELMRQEGIDVLEEWFRRGEECIPSPLLARRRPAFEPNSLRKRPVGRAPSASWPGSASFLLRHT